MTRLTLTIQQRKAHRADAHHLDPVVMIGSDGLTPAVTKEVDNALKSHGLIKVRVLGDDREARLGYYNELADALGAAQINNIGKLLVLWRPKVAKEKTVDEDRMAGPKDVKILKYASR
jgi:putative YhbY family RNA-binding protein